MWGTARPNLTGGASRQPGLLDLADALSLFGPRASHCTGCDDPASGGLTLEPGVTGAPVLRPSHSFFTLAGLLGLAPFLAALTLPLARRLLALGQLSLLLRFLSRSTLLGGVGLVGGWSLGSGVVRGLNGK